MNHDPLDPLDPLDPMTPDDGLLAVSAILDGIASADDRARVESDPALTELLVRLGDQRTTLAAVAVPEAARERALAAALAAFDELDTSATAPTAAATAATAAPSAANVVRFERRRRTYRVLSGVAAAVAVLFVGAVAIGGLGGRDDDSTASMADAVSGDEEPTAELGAAAEAERTGAPAADAPMAVESDGASADAGSSETADADPFASTDPSASSTMEADTAMVEPSAAPAATDAPTGDDSAGGTGSSDGVAEIDEAAGVVVTISTPQELLAYASSQPPYLALPGLPLPCVADGNEAFGEVTYQGEQVVVVRDPSGVVSALDLRRACAVVVTVGP
jgi:hypothetical protein